MRNHIMLALAAWLLSGCALLELAQTEPSPASAATAPASGVMVIVNGVRLTRADLDRQMALVQVMGWLTTGSRPGDLDESAQVEKWIDAELMVQAASRDGVQVSADDARAEIARLLEAEHGTEDELTRQLALGGATRDDLTQYEVRLLTVQRYSDGDVFAGASAVERATKLATWLARARGAAKIEKPSAKAAAATVGTYAGTAAPEFQLRGMDGAQHRLSDLKGQVALINFWATWCGPCRAEMPAIQGVYDAHKSEGFVVWGVNDGEDESLVGPYLQSLRLSFPVMLDGDSRVGRLYRVYALPSTFFIGRDGVIKQVIIGEMNAASLDATVKKLLQ